MNETKRQKLSETKALTKGVFATFAKTEQGVHQVEDWPDAMLVAEGRRDPPNVRALDVLIARHWKALFARCQMLTVDHERASNLAHAAWRQILQTGCGLHPDEDFRAHLIMTATNLWRQRAETLHLAGTVVAHREFSADDPPFVDVGEEAAFLGATVADLKCLSEAEQTRLELEIDGALLRLTPRQRDAVLSHYLNDESCADIGSLPRPGQPLDVFIS
jgi:DNA-directed RNA polymerase specialized sigma24 family protein